MTDEEIRETLEYMQTLEVTQGPTAGQKLKLLPWQTDFIKQVYQPDISRAALSVPRGNGKTTLIAALATAAFFGPHARKGSEIIIVASSFQQAKIAFDHIYHFAFVEIETQKIYAPRNWRVTNNNQACEISYLPDRKKIKVIGSDPKRAHGLAPTMVICDEPAQWPANFGQAMVSALTTAMGKQGSELMIALGTRPADPDHWFQRWLDGEADIGIAYSAKETEDFMSDEAFMLANPSAPYMPSIIKAGLSERDTAFNSEDMLASYKALRLNMGLNDVKAESVVSIEDWQKCETGALPPKEGPCVWGVDLGGGAAMSAIAGYWPQTGRLEVAAAFPDYISLEDRGRKDNVGDRYRQMALRGELFTTPGRIVEVPALIREAYKLFGVPAVVCADRWKANELMDALDKAGVPAGMFSPRGEGYKDGGEDSRLFVTAVQTGKVKIAPSLLMRHAISGAVMITDPAGNRKLSKSGDGTTRKARHRDDALAATMKAVSEGMRNTALQSWSNGVSSIAGSYKATANV